MHATSPQYARPMSSPTTWTVLRALAISGWAREKMVVPSGTIHGRDAIGTSAYSRLSDWPGGGVIGIHGTNSHG
jgi:hypothetical protein